jgi:hypothetical protein
MIDEFMEFLCDDTLKEVRQLPSSGSSKYLVMFRCLAINRACKFSKVIASMQSKGKVDKVC